MFTAAATVGTNASCFHLLLGRLLPYSSSSPRTPIDGAAVHDPLIDRYVGSDIYWRP